MFLIDAQGTNEPLTEKVFAQATCPSMFCSGTSWIREEFRQTLQVPTPECPDEGVFADLHLTLIGPIFA